MSAEARNSYKCASLASSLSCTSSTFSVHESFSPYKRLLNLTMTSPPVTSIPIPPEVPDNGATLPSQGSLSFGPNVLIFNPSMSSTDIQSQVDNIFQTQQSNQFGSQRYALFFTPGNYTLNLQVGFYTTVHGLGTTPDAVTITGGVNALAAWNNDNATLNFWRGVENLGVVPTQFSSNTIWATSQATWLRRVHVHGTLWLFDYISQGPNNFSSGGFITDSIVDTSIISGSQQQYLTRNTTLTNWQGQVWNMVFVGDNNPPSGSWPANKYTVIATTPTVREKPYLVVDSSNDYSVVVPALKQNSLGPSWNSSGNLTPSTSLPLSAFYVAQASQDNATTLNIALQRGLHLLLTPGVYTLSQPIVVRNANTVVLGIGLATLQPTQGTPAIIVADVDGVTIAGLLLDAGTTNSPNLIQIGDVSVSTVDHSANPTALFDVSCRVGGAAPSAQVTSCMVLNSANVIIDNIWLWRADHGVQPSYVGWTINPARNGIIVNSDNVIAYGLFVEHFEGFQTHWKGNGGNVFFYQSEIPYDVPSQSEWMQNGEKGFPSYKVGKNVTSHSGQGVGVYCNFNNPVQLDNAIETPTGSGINMQHLVTVWLSGAQGSSINNIINGTGGPVASSLNVSPT